MKCNQVNCNEPAAYRFTWPGRDEEPICKKHVVKLELVAHALGFPLQIIPLKTTPQAEIVKGPTD